MSDTTFERSLLALTILMIIWLVAGIILGLLPVAWVIISAIVIEIVAGGFLVHYWGKDYMNRKEL